MSSRGVVGLVALAALAAAGSGAAASHPVVSLADGQIRFFVPGTLRTGDVVRCDTLQVKLTAPPSPALSTGTYAWTKGGLSLQIERRPNGATEIACGTALAEPRRATFPYVIGQNGLALIRGPNGLARLERVFGAGSRHPGSTTCRVTWPALGLQATFAGAHCRSGSILRTATVRGGKWSSLNGVQIGETVAEMRWQFPGTKRISSAHGHTVWLLSTAIASSSQLFAVTGPGGTVTSLTNVIR